ncbi:polysaccharide deacetylase family protein [Micromonospora rhizosphaerae]|nr:polysaccharide deacetylase family protein [Micromonospora rhizosphaerae]
MVTLAVAACTAPHDPADGTSDTRDATVEPGSPSPTQTPDAAGQLAGSSGAPVTNAGKGTLAYYMERIPRFPAPPPPTKLVLPRTPDSAAFQFEIPTTDKVAFLTIDDGTVPHPWALPLLQAANVPVTLFLTTNTIRDHIEYFRALQQAGAVIESHTVSHPQLTTLGYERQKYELCHAADQLGEWYGQRPTLFRPPYGEKNADTLRAAWSCGLLAGFNWRESARNRGVAYQRPDHRVHAGDIILMHFRATFPDDFVAALRAIKAAGLTPAALGDYAHVTPIRTPDAVPRNPL